MSKVGFVSYSLQSRFSMTTRIFEKKKFKKNLTNNNAIIKLRMNDLILLVKKCQKTNRRSKTALAHTHTHYSCTTVYIQRKYIIIIMRTCGAAASRVIRSRPQLLNSPSSFLTAVNAHRNNNKISFYFFF